MTLFRVRVPGPLRTAGHGVPQSQLAWQTVAVPPHSKRRGTETLKAQPRISLGPTGCRSAARRQGLRTQA